MLTAVMSTVEQGRCITAHSDQCVLPSEADPAHKDLTLASFNIQFLGHFKDRKNQALTELLAPLRRGAGAGVWWRPAPIPGVLP